MLKVIFCAALILARSTLAAGHDYVAHESRDALSTRWIRGKRVQPDANVLVRIGLMQSNLDNAEDYLMAVSHPESPTYGQHWTAERVIETFKPSDETISTVRNWLADGGIRKPTLTDNKAWLVFHAPAKQVEQLLRTKYHEHEDQLTKRTLLSTDEYHIPRHVDAHIDYVSPSLHLHGALTGSQRIQSTSQNEQNHHLEVRIPVEEVSADASNGSTKDDLKHCDTLTTPACIAALYKIPPSTLQPNASNAMGIYESGNIRWDQKDLDLFFANYTNGHIPNGTHPATFGIDGGRAKTLKGYESPNGFEASGDLDMSYPIVYPQEIVIYDENDLHYQSWANDTALWGFNQLLDAIDGSYCNFTAYGETGDLPGVDPTYPDHHSHGGYNHPLQCGVFKAPNVLSISYGGQEGDLPIAYQKRQCLEFLKLGLQGTTFVFASGDNGVASPPEPPGFGQDGSTGCLGPKRNVFNPAWPNTCPWITNVGATTIIPGHNITEGQPEAAAFRAVSGPPRNTTNDYSSGGGFSNLYPMPSYQRASVQSYLTHHGPTYPSYAKLAPNEPNPLKVNVTALQEDTGGLYNRLGRGYPDVSANGQNLAITQLGMGFSVDGTSGSAPIFGSIVNRINEERMAVGKGPVGFINPVLYAHPEILNDVTVGNNVGCQTEGFKAAAGWDPATGLGTPNYPKMLEFFLQLP